MRQQQQRKPLSSDPFGTNSSRAQPHQAGGGIRGRGVAFGGRGGTTTQGVVVTKSLHALLQSSLSNGVLNLSHKHLTEVPREVFNLHEMQFEGKEWWTEADLTRLDLSFNEIQVIPDGITNLNFLTSLILSNNKLVEMNPEMFALPLERVLVAHNALTVVPPELAQCATIVELDFSHNKLKSFDAQTLLIGLPALQGLFLSGNGLTDEFDLVAALQMCPKLQKVDLSQNGLSSVGSSAACVACPALTYLNLSKNRIQAMPTLRGGGLSILDLTHNALTTPPTLEHLPKLVELHLGYNKLTAFPDFPHVDLLHFVDIRNNNISTGLRELAPLKSLKRLDVSNNNISQLDPALGSLPQLTALYLDGNPLRGVRREIIQKGTIEVLKYLRSRASVDPDLVTSGVGNAACVQEKHNGVWDLSCTNPSNRLSEIPEDVLTRDMDAVGLRLNRHALAEVPMGVTRLRNLVKLEMSDNVLVQVPLEIRALSRLESVDFSKNRLTEFPIGLLGLTCLVSVNLSFNRIQGLPEEMCGEHWPRVSELNVSSNSITRLPDGLCSMKTLSSLLCADNKISYVPAAITQLSSLATLALHNNDLLEIPLAIGTMPLRSLTLEGNRMKWLRPATMQQGTNAVLKYLRDRMPIQ